MEIRIGSFLLPRIATQSFLQTKNRRFVFSHQTEPSVIQNFLRCVKNLIRNIPNYIPRKKIMTLPIAKTEGIILKVNLTKLTSRSKLLVFLKHPRTYPGDILHSFSIRVPNCRDHYARLIRARRVRGIKQPSTSVPETLRKKKRHRRRERATLSVNSPNKIHPV